MESAVRMVAARLATELCEPEIYQTCYKAGYVCVCLLKKSVDGAIVDVVVN